MIDSTVYGIISVLCYDNYDLFSLEGKKEEELEVVASWEEVCFWLYLFMPMAHKGDAPDSVHKSCVRQ